MKSDIKQYNLKHNGIISDYKNNKFNDNKIVNKQLKQATKNLKDFIKNKYNNEELLSEIYKNIKSNIF